MPEELLECPTRCPNRKTEGLVVFGHRVDPIEALLHVAILVIFMVPAAKRSNSEAFTFQEGLGWFGGLAIASSLIRMAPTQRLDAYAKLFSQKN